MIKARIKIFLWCSVLFLSGCSLIHDKIHPTPATPPPDNNSACVNFGTDAPGSRPTHWRIEEMVVVTEKNRMQTQPQVIQVDSSIGLEVTEKTVITLLMPAPKIELSIARFSGSGVVRAINSAGVEVAREVISDLSETLQTISLVAGAISTVEITTTESKILLLEACALGRDVNAPLISIVAAGRSVEAKVMFDAFLYDDNDEVSITLIVPPDITSSLPEYAAVISSPSTGDLEAIQLTTSATGRYQGNGIDGTSLSLSFTEGEGQFDGRLRVQPGELITVMVFSPGAQWISAGVDASLLSGHAVVAARSVSPASAVVQRPDLASIMAGGTDDPRQPAVLTTDGALPLIIPTRELIFYPTSSTQEALFLERVNGTVVSRQPIEYTGSDREAGQFTEAILVNIDPDRLMDLAHVPGLREILDSAGSELYVSNERVAQLYGTVLGLRLQGFFVAVNPRLEQQGTFAEEDRGSFTATMIASSNFAEHNADRNRLENGLTIPGCIPDSKTSCILNVPYLWREAALLDVDEAVVRVAVLDSGFSINEDFRDGSTSDQCEVNFPFGVRCGPGLAEGPQLAGNSLFGGRRWHGNGVVSTLGGVLDNEKTAGVGGQVVRPVLYRFNLGSYAFDMGLAVRHAVDENNVSCINISAGYPCSIVTNIGPDLDICTRGGRLAICGLATAALFTSAASICAVAAGLTAILIVGPLLAPGAVAACAASNIAATTASISCLATLAPDNPRGPLHSSIQYAYSRGVPVVTVSGNDLSGGDAVPEVLRGIVNLANNDMQAWQVIPGIFPESITVGSVTVGSVNGAGAQNLTNVDFQGRGVDIWAPIRSTYFRPPSPDINAAAIDHIPDPLGIGGTSAAAPYVSGVVALMQAANPRLNPQTAAGRARLGIDIVEDIRSHLVNTAFTDAELIAAGYPSDLERPRVINPIGAFEAAAITRVAHPTLGYSRTFDRYDVPSGQYRGTTIFSIDSSSTLAMAAGSFTGGDLLLDGIDVPVSFAYLFPSAEIAAEANPPREPGIARPAAWALYETDDIVGSTRLQGDRVILPFPGNDSDISVGEMHRILRASLDVVLPSSPGGPDKRVAIVHGAGVAIPTSVSGLTLRLVSLYIRSGVTFNQTFVPFLVSDDNLSSLSTFDAVIITGTSDPDRVASIASLNKPILVWAGRSGRNISALGLATGPGDHADVPISLGAGTDSRRETLSGTKLDSDDWLSLEAAGGTRTVSYQVELKSPLSGGTLNLVGSGLTDISSSTVGGGRSTEQIQRFRTPNILPGGTYRFKIIGNDNFYKVSFGNPLLGAEVGPDRFDANNPVFTPAESRPNNNIASRAARLGEREGEPELEWIPGRAIPPLMFEWSLRPALTPAGTEVPLNFYPAGDEDWFVITDPPIRIFDQCNTNILIDDIPPTVLVQLYRRRGDGTMEEIRRPRGERRNIFELSNIDSGDIFLHFSPRDPGAMAFLTYAPTITFSTLNRALPFLPMSCR